MNPRLGIKECNKFFLTHRANVRCKGMTYNEFLSARQEDLPEWVQRKLTTMNRRGIYQLYYGSVKNYRPSSAIEVYTKYNSRNVIDPYAGWGGRLFGALTLGINYTGFDTNTNLTEPYRQLIEAYNTNGSTVAMNFVDSSTVDYSKHTYDTILTSPPYYDRELYEGMTYTSKEDFEEKVLKPTLTSLWRHLAVGGVMALNIPNNMYKYIKTLFGSETEKLPYSNVRGNGGTYTEYTYVWRKVNA